MDGLLFIRDILPGDNKDLAAVVRKVMSEFDADPATTIVGDPSLDSMFENYDEPRARYHIAVYNDRLAGGCGIRKLDGGDEDTCELQRMFLLPEARGKGIGKKLLELCIQDAIKFNYRKIYLETLSQMNTAINLYEKCGFRKTERRIGSTGHSGCNFCMILDLTVV